MTLFLDNGCLSDEGLHALAAGQLNELERLEAAEHLAYCDRCVDRYTALLAGHTLEEPPADISGPMRRMFWARLMQNVWGRAAVAAAAAVLAMGMWRSGLPQKPSRSEMPVQLPERAIARYESGWQTSELVTDASDAFHSALQTAGDALDGLIKDWERSD